jgi:hypothetical protein
MSLIFVYQLTILMSSHAGYAAGYMNLNGHKLKLLHDPGW